MEIVVVVPDAKNACSELVASEIEPLSWLLAIISSWLLVASPANFLSAENRKVRSIFLSNLMLCMCYVVCGVLEKNIYN